MQSFEKRQVRDAASEVPADYTPPDFTTAALQHTNVKLTWDADDDTRKKALRKKMTEDDIKDDDFKVSSQAHNAQHIAFSFQDALQSNNIGPGMNYLGCMSATVWCPWPPVDRQNVLHQTLCSYRQPGLKL